MITQTTQMTTQDLITIPEASKLTGKAPITIRRTILKHRKEVLAKKIRGKWCADREAILKHYDITSGESAPGVPGVPVNIIEILQDQLAANKDQLAIKDKQIAEINERLREMNIMLHKNQLAITEKGNDMYDGEKKSIKDKKKTLVLTDYMIIVAVVILLWLTGLMTFG